jgi:hypothetical protein
MPTTSLHCIVAKLPQQCACRLAAASPRHGPSLYHVASTQLDGMPHSPLAIPGHTAHTPCVMVAPPWCAETAFEVLPSRLVADIMPTPLLPFPTN